MILSQAHRFSWKSFYAKNISSLWLQIHGNYDVYCGFLILMVVSMIQTFQESIIAAGAGLALVDSVVISQPGMSISW